MDLLMECASVFKNLMNYQYRFTLGRKGKLKVITLGFSETDFHHLVGLHKLRDTEVARATAVPSSGLFCRVVLHTPQLSKVHL